LGLRPRSPRLAHVASLALGWPMTPTTPTPRRVANVVITHDGESLTHVYAHERESFTLGGYSRIGTPGRCSAGDGRGNANRVRQSFFRKKNIGEPHAN
jgi:hypothetical protein